MSKSKGNVVSPDSFVDEYGADVFRLYLMFLGPFAEGAGWSDTGIKGAARFVRRVYSYFSGVDFLAGDCPENPEITREVHLAIDSMTTDIERLHFNTAVSAMMKLLNIIERTSSISRSSGEIFVRLLAPLAPHLAEELWCECLGREFSVFDAGWPVANPDLLKNTEVEVPVMINKRVCAKIMVPSGIDADSQQRIAEADPAVQDYLLKRGLKIMRVISKPEMIVTIVAEC